ncbi:uncharacterized protein VTP21DRAFT_10376 [Calcarisporiella thermophila]|uniref:uncharacterized protein n=1 Tax=Calcarisporiella thermophila TaxID=911321 RepID=UPI00374289B6
MAVYDPLLRLNTDTSIHSQKTARERLSSFINDNHRLFNIEWGEGFPNHLVPVLLSLYDMGASPERLQNVYNNMSSDLLRTRAPQIDIKDENWTDFFGQKKYYREYLAFFDSCIDRMGIFPAFQHYFPILLPGCLGAAMHPLCHIAYGLEFKDALIVAEGLAYASIAYFSFGDMIEHGGNTKRGLCRDVLEMVRADKRFDGTFDGTFQGKWKVLLRSRESLLKIYLNHYGVQEEESAETITAILHDLTKMATYLLAATLPGPDTPSSSPPFTITQPSTFFTSETTKTTRHLDFFLAHAFLGIEAIHSVLPHLQVHDQTRLLRVYFVALLATYIVQGRPAFHPELLLANASENCSTPGRDDDWTRIVNEAIESEDIHVPLLVRALLKARFKYPSESEVYLRGALRMLEFIKTERDWEVEGIGW